MKYLIDFAAFVRQYKVDEFVSSHLKNITEWNVSILKLFKHLSPTELTELTRESLENYLIAFEEGTAIQNAITNLAEWKKDQLPGIPKNAVEFTDVLHVYSSQKLAMTGLLPLFTQDVLVATKVVQELEDYYREVNAIALEIIKETQLQEHQKRIETEEKYHDLFDNANDLVHLSSPKGEILYVNNSWITTLGYRKEEMIGKMIFDFLKPDETERFSQYRNLVINGENDKEGITTYLLDKQGKEIAVEGYISCKYQDGIPEYTRAILKNVTEKKAQEEKLKFHNQQLIEREENLAQLVEHAPDAIIVINRENTILLWNPKAEEIFGWKSNEVLGQFLPDVIVPEEVRQAHIKGMVRYLATGESNIINSTAEVIALKKGGERLFISLTISKSTREGNPIFIASIRDITLQKLNEKELENKRLQLEHTNKELEQYAWLTSHDLKEPLRKVLTFSNELLQKHVADSGSKIAEYLQKINRSARRMDRLIEAILLYSNVSDDESLFTTTDLNEEAAEVVEDLEMSIKSQFATVNIGPLPVLKAIPVQMRQLFQNLLSNALKYQKPGVKPVVDICSKLIDDEYHISIKDNGVGFDDTYRHKIFQVFQRLSHNSRYEGTGIGLALCKKIVEAHKGSIYATSKEGEGSTFVVILPAHL